MPDFPSAARSMQWAGESIDAPCSGPSLANELEALYNSHAETLLRFSINATGDMEFARESVQEVFLRYAELRHGGPAPPTALVWLLREVRQRIARRSQERDRHVSTRLSKYRAADPTPSPEYLALANEARRLMDRLAAPRELECFVLRSEGLSYLEIANVMDISVGTVGATLARAVKKLEVAFDIPVDPKK